MSVSFTWKPTDPRQGESWGGGSSLHSAMENAFGGFPITLNRESIKTLEGIAACGYDDIRHIISAIVKHDSIEIDAHW